MTDSKISVLIVGAGPAGLATAIHLKKQLNTAGRNESVVVIDKAPKLGYHSLSGAVFESECLDELLPDWQSDPDPFVKTFKDNFVEQDDIHFLTSKWHFKLPSFLLPGGMKHKGDRMVSVSRLSEWLGKKAEALGVEIYTGFSVREVMVENGRVTGVLIGEKGLGHDGRKKSNYQPAEKILADVTVLADGSLGSVSTEFIEKMKLAQPNPQIYSVGIKQLLKLPKDNNFGSKRLIHTLGYPNRRRVFGGGFMYDMGDNVLALGLILGLDWQYTDLNPELEMELFKAQPFIAKLIEGHEILSTGAKTLPEGGFYSLPKNYVDGGLIIGDAAGFSNVSKLKALHLAIKSGMAAADALNDAIISADFSETTLQAYAANLEKRNVTGELKKSRNARQGFTTPLGLYFGAPFTLIQQLLPLKWKIKADHEHLQPRKLNRTQQPELDRAGFVGFSGAMHEEDEFPHVRILDQNVCAKCAKLYDMPCLAFCPGEVYAPAESANGVQILVSPSNCLHDRSCVAKCPFQNIFWTAPEGGEGPKYANM